MRCASAGTRDEAYCAFIGDQISCGLFDLREYCVGATFDVPFIHEAANRLWRWR